MQGWWWWSELYLGGGTHRRSKVSSYSSDIFSLYFGKNGGGSEWYCILVHHEYVCGLTRRRQWNLIRRDQMTRTNRTSGRYVSLECWSKFHQIWSCLIYSKSLFSVLKIFVKCIVHEIHIEIQGTFLCFHDTLVSWKAKTIKIKWNLERKHLRKLYHWGHMQCCYCALVSTKPHRCGNNVLLVGDTFRQWIIKPSPMHHNISCSGQGAHFPPEPQRWHLYCFQGVALVGTTNFGDAQEELCLTNNITSPDDLRLGASS
jgi:hypothetical protein